MTELNTALRLVMGIEPTTVDYRQLQPDAVSLREKKEKKINRSTNLTHVKYSKQLIHLTSIYTKLDQRSREKATIELFLNLLFFLFKA